MVLVAPTRGGKQHHKRIESETKRKCTDWLEGHRGSLWRAPDNRQSAPRQKQTEAAQRHQKAMDMLQEELLQQACAALVNDPPVDINSAVVNEMRAKHPSARVGER